MENETGVRVKGGVGVGVVAGAGVGVGVRTEGREGVAGWSKCCQLQPPFDIMHSTLQHSFFVRITEATISDLVLSTDCTIPCPPTLFCLVLP